jgi:hypothetical protein
MAHGRNGVGFDHQAGVPWSAAFGEQYLHCLLALGGRRFQVFTEVRFFQLFLRYRGGLSMQGLDDNAASYAGLYEAPQAEQ